MSSFHYTWFDFWVARLRQRAARPHLHQNSRICDLGCGVDALFLRTILPVTRFRVGVDYQEVPVRLPATAFVRTDICRGLPFRDASFDDVTMLAVLEHLEDPVPLFVEARRVLVPGGSLIVTWPCAVVDPLLDALMAIGIVARETEIDKHQPRKSAAHWMQTLREIGFTEVAHRRFEFGVNNLLVAHKPRATRT